MIAGAATLGKRLALLPNVIAVTEAIAYAHAEGVIHRDLKPANILVGAFGETVVIDWGLAKDLRARDTADEDDADPAAPAAAGPYRALAADETAHGKVMGTPAYMSLEQARGERADERSDVYALGAILYHLLAGAPPYARADEVGVPWETVLARVLAAPAPALATLQPEVPADLLAIVARAMARAPADRYPSAGGLADDLRRFQTGQLVGAHRYSGWQLARRWLRRNRTPVAVGGVALVLLAAVAVFSVVRIVDERDAAIAARAEAETQRHLAETQRGAAEDVVGFVMTELKPGLVRVGRLDLMSGVGKTVDAYYDRVTTVADLDPAAIGRRADALATLGDVLEKANDTPGGQRAYERSVAILDPARDQIAIARAQLGIVQALNEQGDGSGALALVDRAEAALATATPGPEVDLAVAKLERQRGIEQINHGQHADAIASYDRALARLQTAAAARPRDRAIRAEQAKAYDRRCDARQAGGDRAGGIADAKAGLAIREQLSTEDPGDVTIQEGMIVSWDKLFVLQSTGNDMEAAQRSADREIAIAEQLVRIDPANAEWSNLLLGALEHPPRLAYARDDFAKAAALMDRPLAIAQAAVDRTPDSIESQTNLMITCAEAANDYTFANQVARGLELAQRSLEIAELLHARSPDSVPVYRGVGIAHERVGDAYTKNSDAVHASAEYQARLTIDEELQRRDPDNPRRAIDVANSMNLTGRALAFQPARAAEGIAMMEKANASLHALDQAGKLTPEVTASLPDLDQQLVRTRAAAARGATR